MGSHNHGVLTCVLRVEPNCHACKMHTFEILGTVEGVYDVTIDAETKTARIVGEVNPTLLLKALGRVGIHAELISTHLTHPRLAARAQYYDPYGSNYPRLGGGWYDPYDRPFQYGSYNSLGGYYDRPFQRFLPGYSYNNYYY